MIYEASMVLTFDVCTMALAALLHETNVDVHLCKSIFAKVNGAKKYVVRSD